MFPGKNVQSFDGVSRKECSVQLLHYDQNVTIHTGKEPLVKFFYFFCVEHMQLTSISALQIWHIFSCIISKRINIFHVYLKTRLLKENKHTHIDLYEYKYKYKHV